MRLHDYYQDQKFCRGCGRYVHYLRALERCYCVVCGDEVRLFSSGDAASFRRALARERGTRLHGLEPAAESQDAERVGA